MVLGAGTFIPSGQFAFPRSYLRGIWLSFDTPAIVNWTYNRVTFADSVTPVVTGAISIFYNAWAWSSNRYTVDHMVTESWYSFDNGVTKIPLPFALTWFLDSDFSTWLVYNPFSALGTGAFKHDMPAAPPSYWRPMPWE